MFQQSERWFQLFQYVAIRAAHGVEQDNVGEALGELELLVRTEKQAANLEVLIEEVCDAYGCNFEDYLHE